MLKTCLICQYNLKEELKSCPQCGVRFDENILQEVNSINYLLREVPAWRNNKLIEPWVEQELFRFYGGRRHSLIQSILPQISSIEVNITTPELSPNTFLVKSQQPTSDNVSLINDITTDNTSNILITENSKLNQVSEINTANNISMEALQDIAVRNVKNVKATNVVASNSNEANISHNKSFNFVPPPLPEAKKPLGEIVAENINTIFAVSAALFVGGVALYYRNEIYRGLTQPIVQAVILMLVTLASLVTGTVLVRKTAEHVAGRALSLTGALLVPINPWFLVHSSLITDTGRGWVLGLACTFLYGSIAYFLRDSLFVYLSLVTGLITSWVLAYKFAGNVASTSTYAVVLMVYSIICLFAEQHFKLASTETEFSREKIGRPFFHFAQVGIALTLLFYTPLIDLLPKEFIATKKHFDPSYSSLMTVWLALAAAFAYSYSAVVRRASYFVYMAIAALYWSEISLFIHLKSSISNFYLAIAGTTLLLGVVGQKANLEEFYSKPISLFTRAVGEIYLVIAVVYLLFAISASWTTILAFVLVAIMFQAKLNNLSSEQITYRVALLSLVAYILSLTNLALDKDIFLILQPSIAVVALVLSSRLEKTNQSSLSQAWQKISLLIVTISIYKLAQMSISKDFDYLTLAIFWLEIALIFAALSYQLKEESYKILPAIFSTSLGIIAYGLVLAKYNYLDRKEALVAFALLAFIYFAVSQTTILWQAIKDAFSYLSVFLSSALLLCCSWLTLELVIENKTSVFAAPIALTLALIGAKEFLHLKEQKHLLNSILLGVIGILFVPNLLAILSITSHRSLFFVLTTLAISYLIIAKLEKRQIDKEIYATFEVLANLVIVISGLGFLAIGYNFYTDQFSFFTTLGFLQIVLFYGLGTYLSNDQKLSQAYSHFTFSLLLVTTCLFGNYCGLRNWGDLAAILMPVLMLYLVADAFLSKTKFVGASAVAQFAQPLVIALGLWSGLFRTTTHIATAFFFAEIAAFYLLATIIRKEVVNFYVAQVAIVITSWKLLQYVNVETSYFMIFYAIYGAALFYIENKTKAAYQWLNLAISNSASGVLAFTLLGITFQSLFSLELNDPNLTPYLVSLLVITGIFALLSTKLENQALKQFYKISTFYLGGLTYLTLGVRLGYDLLTQTEFYSLPIGALILWAGYSAKKKSEKIGDFWLALGALLWVLPTMLHVMGYRFITRQPALEYDFTLLLCSLALILGGILLQIKTPVMIGGASFLTAIAIIVFSVVQWEQQWLSVVMILLAIIVFVSAWAIHYRYKHHQSTESTHIN